MITPRILRVILAKKFPSANFRVYFDFLESLPVLKRGLGIHRHHILPKKEFPEQRKNQDNLMFLTIGDHFRAHYYLALAVPDCLSFQRTFFCMANASACKVQKEELPEYVKIYERGRAEQVRYARKNGAIQGRRSVESGRLAKFSSKGASVAGRIAVETGQLASIRTPEHQQKAAKAAGDVAVKSGQIQALGRKNAQSGQLASVRVLWNSSAALRANKKANCKRWNISRGKPCICEQHDE